MEAKVNGMSIFFLFWREKYDFFFFFFNYNLRRKDKLETESTEIFQSVLTNEYD